MFILNKRNNKIQECHNADAIKICRQDSANYAVAETMEELLGKALKKGQEQPETNAGKECMAEESKVAPEAAQKAQEDTSEAEETREAASDGWEQLPEEEKVEALEAKTVSDLRKIAKEIGIQGYANMNKGTLVAMIMNH